MTRAELLDWLWPRCDRVHAALLYPGSDGKPRPGWIHDERDVERARAAFLDGTLPGERFESRTKSGAAYTIEGASSLGLMLHHEGAVSALCIDLDDHTDDGGNVHLGRSLARWLGAEPVVFSSRGGKGLHCFFTLADPVTVGGFVAWARAWGFNRKDGPEVFPKTDKLSQVWMPGEPNAEGGDAYVSGSFETAVVGALPEPPPVALTSKTLGFLRGEATQPGRNARLNVAALELAEKGVERPRAWSLCQRAAQLCGLEPGETERTFESGYNAGRNSSHQRPQSPVVIADGTYEDNGCGNAGRFVSAHGRDAKYCAARGCWYVWDTNRWSPDTIRAEGLAKLTAQSIEEGKHRKYSCSRRGVEEMLFMARSEPGMAVGPEQFDADPMLFNCQSGSIDLRTGEQRRHDRGDLLSRISPARYSPEASCPRWLGFLDTVFASDAELIEYIQRVCGYMLTGDVREHCLFFLYGDGGNGKSVFCSLLQHILGDYARKLPAQSLSRSERAAGEGPTPYLSGLVGARLAVASELEEGQRFAEAKIKDLTGGDRLTARGLRQAPIEFMPTHKLVLYGNHKPEITGDDRGIWRRIHLIPFAVTIHESDRDPELTEKLKAESAAILAWMVRGCLQWSRQGGLRPPAAVVDATRGFRAESDAIGRFLDERCTLADGVFVAKGELHEIYARWCAASGEEPLSKNPFGTRLKRRGIAEKRTHAGWLWVGIEPRDGREAGDA